MSCFDIRFCIKSGTSLEDEKYRIDARIRTSDEQNNTATSLKVLKDLGLSPRRLFRMKRLTPNKKDMDKIMEFMATVLSFSLLAEPVNSSVPTYITNPSVEKIKKNNPNPRFFRISKIVMMAVRTR